MTKAELVETLRTEAREIEALMKKLQTRCNHIKSLAEQIENSGKKNQQDETPNKFWKAVDKVFGEKKK
jgi:hypothetical protein